MLSCHVRISLINFTKMGDVALIVSLKRICIESVFLLFKLWGIYEQTSTLPYASVVPSFQSATLESLYKIDVTHLIIIYFVKEVDDWPPSTDC